MTADLEEQELDRGDLIPGGEEEEVAKSADEQAEELETPDEQAEREADEAEQANKKRVRIPLARHEDILNKARQREEALAQRVAELERHTPAPQQQQQQRNVLGEMKSQIDTLQDTYESHVFEGEKAEARAVRQQLEALREQYMDAKVSATGAMARNQTLETLKYDQSLAKVEADYPALNPDNDASFDEDKANEVAGLMQMFQQNGLTRTAALAKAVQYAMGNATARPGDTAADLMAQRRAQEARTRAQDTQRRQPPNGNIAGTDNGKLGGKNPTGIDIMKMSQEKFAKIDEETLSAMRGDTV